MYNLILVIYALGGPTHVTAEFDTYLSCNIAKNDQVKQLEKTGSKIASAGCYKK